MAWETKYILGHYDHFANKWDAHFQREDYSGGVTYMQGAGSQPIVISVERVGEFTHSPVKASYATFSIIEDETDEYVDIVEYDKATKVCIYKNDVLYWQGWGLSGTYRTQYNLPPHTITFEAVDGLTLLKTVDFSVATTDIVGPDYYVLYKIFKQITDEIGLENNIFESLALREYRMVTTQSPLTQIIRHTDLYFTGWEDGVDTYKDLYTILENELRWMGARMYQKDGNWYIDHVKQLRDDSITYRKYTSSWVYLTTANETRQKNITSGHDSPLLAQVELSLHKEIERPLSKLEIEADFSITNNLLHHPTVFTVNGDLQYTITDDFLLRIADTGTEHYNEGIVYSLGRVAFTGFVEGETVFTFSTAGRVKGTWKVRLYVDNEADGYRYYYNADAVEVGGMDLHEKTWYSAADLSGVTNALKACNLYEVENETMGQPDSFSDSVDVVKQGSTTLIGQMYLVLVPPHDTLTILGVPSPGYVYVNMDELSLTYDETTKENRKVVIQNDLLKVKNEKSISLSIYSEPRKKSHGYIYDDGVPRTGGYSTNITPYNNPHLLFPGMNYYDDGTRYQPCYEYSYADLGQRIVLEEWLAQDIMTYYSNLRWKLDGSLIGEFGFENTLYYKNKLYMIDSIYYDTHSAIAEVVLLQISEVIDWLLTESGDYIVYTESDEGVII